MQSYLIFQKPSELIKKFRGKILIFKNYQSDPELDFYVGDLIEVDDINHALGEIESRESDFTEIGKKYLEYAFQNSDLEDLLKEYVYRSDYIKNSADLLSYGALEVSQRDTTRVFNVLKPPHEIEDIASHLGIDVKRLYPDEISAYDAAYQVLFKAFNSYFEGENAIPTRNFCAYYTSSDSKRKVYIYLFKKNFSLEFNPILYSQEISDGKGIEMRSDRETIKVFPPGLANTIINYKKPDFSEHAIRLFEYLGNQAHELLEVPFNLQNFLKQKGVPHVIVPAGELWDDIRASR